MALLLCLIFFLSGAAALIFETLWFRQAGLAFGNSVWASSLVLASFMAGLALGNGLAARLGSRIERPVRLYALIEVVIAITGVSLVLALPHISELWAPWFRALEDYPWALNGVRLVGAFLLLLVPSTAMGATLPVVAKALLTSDPRFGAVLGRLYGWNTSGAVLGALLSEIWLVEWVGVRGTAFLAGGFDLVAAAAAMLLAPHFDRQVRAESMGARTALSVGALRLCFAAFLAGFLLLALEVVWFRFLHLFVHSGPLAFAVMLGVVLSGIGLGGFVGGGWLGRNDEADTHARAVAWLAGALLVGLYTGFTGIVELLAGNYERDPWRILWISASLQLPVAICSGVIFTLIGNALQREIQNPTRSAGLLTLSNTIGGGLGSIVAGFILLPTLGMERSFFVAAAGYGIIGIVLSGLGQPAGERPNARRHSALALGAGAILLGALVFFPHGLMRGVYLPRVVRNNLPVHGTVIEAVHEGRTETITYARKDFVGRPLHHALLTDGYSMSGSSIPGRRYMKLYTWWPVALTEPGPRSALLISYGVGSTAKSLTDTASLEHIDVVDISREILDLSDIVFPDPAEHPLHDPRVEVHVEDGRFFLQLTERRYDLISGEPPPPKFAGIVSLYTREYFELVRSRLAEGGVHTYWLPVHQLVPSDAKAITAAYCQVFPDCSLWGGADLNWMLVGTRNARFHGDAQLLRRPWLDPAVSPELHATGIEEPEQLGALFMADAEQLSEWVGDTPPLTDDFPKRLSNEFFVGSIHRPLFEQLMETDAARARFVESEFVASIWPAPAREATLSFFDVQKTYNRVASGAGWTPAERFREIKILLETTTLESLPLQLLGSSADHRRLLDAALADGLPREDHLARIAVHHLVARDYEAASQAFSEAQSVAPRRPALVYARTFSECMAGHDESAAAVTREARAWLPRTKPVRGFWMWLSSWCEVPRG